MLKKISITIFVFVIIMISNPVYAADDENQLSNQSIKEKIVNIWNNNAVPFFQEFACSFKKDVWDKTNNWLEKNSFKKIETDKENKENLLENKDKNCDFFDTIHKAITGKESSY